MSDTKWVDDLKAAAEKLGEGQIGVLEYFGQNSDQWRKLYGLRIDLGYEMERLKRVLEREREVKNG